MTQALTAAAPAAVKVLAVDTSCQVPMQTVKCSTSKAYIFRSATEKPRKERMDSMPYSDSGLIARIAPYASQGAAAGAEDHPDAEGGLSRGGRHTAPNTVRMCFALQPGSALPFAQPCPWQLLHLCGCSHLLVCVFSSSMLAQHCISASKHLSSVIRHKLLRRPKDMILFTCQSQGVCLLLCMSWLWSKPALCM